MVSRSFLAIYYKFVTDSKYRCTRQHCHCYDKILETFFMTLQDRQSFLSFMKPVLRSQRECQHVRTHFFPSSYVSDKPK